MNASLVPLHLGALHLGAQHLGALHPAEQALVWLLAFGPFALLGIVVAGRRRQDRRQDRRRERQAELHRDRRAADADAEQAAQRDR